MIRLRFTSSIFACALFMLLLSAQLFGAQTTDTTVTRQTTDTLPSAAVPSSKVGKNSRFIIRHAQNLQRIKDGPIDLVFLGDSITDRWSSAPKVWNSHFAQWHPANFGVGGDRTQNVLWRITHGELDGISPKVVVIMIGTNNTHTDSPDDIIMGIRRIIEVTEQKLPDTKILLLGIFPREPRIRNGKPVTGPMDKIRVINQQLPKLARPGKVRYLDITNRFLVDGKVPENIMPDKVHPSEKGYEIWADAITPVLQEMMK